MLQTCMALRSASNSLRLRSARERPSALLSASDIQAGPRLPPSSDCRSGLPWYAPSHLASLSPHCSLPCSFTLPAIDRAIIVMSCPHLDLAARQRGSRDRESNQLKRLVIFAGGCLDGRRWMRALTGSPVTVRRTCIRVSGLVPALGQLRPRARLPGLLPGGQHSGRVPRLARHPPLPVRRSPPACNRDCLICGAPAR